MIFFECGKNSLLSYSQETAGFSGASCSGLIGGPASVRPGNLVLSHNLGSYRFYVPCKKLLNPQR